MNLKLSKTAIRELTRRYRAVLMAAFVAGAFTATAANAANGDVVAYAHPRKDGDTSPYPHVVSDVDRLGPFHP